MVATIEMILDTVGVAIAANDGEQWCRIQASVGSYLRRGRPPWGRDGYRNVNED